jgi:hypothetical protein
MCRTWDYHRRVGLIVRRDILHVVDGKILRCGAASWCGYHRINDLGHVKALFDVGFEGEVWRWSCPFPESRESRTCFYGLAWDDCHVCMCW